MARIRLREAETKAERLPEVCMACGQPAAAYVAKTFRWYPEWIGVFILLGVLPFWIMAAIMSKYMTVEVPLCEKHGRYFTTRLIALSVIVALIFLIPITVAIFALAVSDRDQAGNSLAAALCIFVPCIIVGVIVIYFIQNRMIRPKEITDRNITLIRVHEDFVEAMQEARDEREYGDERARRRRDDDEDDRPRRRRPPSEPRDPRSTYRAERDSED